jgi:hypothetical protein
MLIVEEAPLNVSPVRPIFHIYTEVGTLEVMVIVEVPKVIALVDTPVELKYPEPEKVILKFAVLNVPACTSIKASCTL